MLCLFPPELLKIFRRVFFTAEDSVDDSTKENHRSEFKGIEYRVRNAVGCVSLHAEIPEDFRQSVGDSRADSDEEALHNEPHGALIIRQLVRYKSPERLHADIDGSIQHP